MNGAKILCRNRVVCSQNGLNSLLLQRMYLHSHYDTLGVKKTATQEEIKCAFVELSKKLHPDVNPNDPKTHEKFVKLNEAYTVLSKPSSRREYDLRICNEPGTSRYGEHPDLRYGPGYRQHRRRQYGPEYYEKRYGEQFRSEYQDPMGESRYHDRRDSFHESEMERKERIETARIHVFGYTIVTLFLGFLTFITSYSAAKARHKHDQMNNRAILDAIESERRRNSRHKTPPEGKPNDRYSYTKWREAVNKTNDSDIR